jgi:hypothetical protein
MIFVISALWIYGSSSWETEVSCVFDSTVEASDRSTTIVDVKLPISTYRPKRHPLPIHHVLGEAFTLRSVILYLVFAFHIFVAKFLI